MPRRPKRRTGFGIGQCSLCDEGTVTFGQQWDGGIRYCKTCLPHTLAWVQITEEKRTEIVGMYDAALASPGNAKLLALMAKLTPEMKKENSIRESSIRLMEQNMREMRGY